MAKSKCTSELIEKAQIEAEKGCTREAIANNIGISKQSFYTYLKENIDFLDAILKGEESCLKKVYNKYIDMALGNCTITETTVEQTDDGHKHVKKVTKQIPPHVGAQIFYLKNKAGMTDRQRIEIVESDLEKFADAGMQIGTEEDEDE